MTAITQFQDLDRLAKLLELGNPSLFEDGSSNGSSNFFGTNVVPKLSSVSVTTTDEHNDTSTEDRHST
jgi:hypothetical protein